MKKLLTLLAISGVSMVAFGQGYLSLNDIVSIHISANNGQTISALPKNTGGTTVYDFSVLEWTNATTPTGAAQISDLANSGWYSTGILGTNGTSTPSTATVTSLNPWVYSGLGNWGSAGGTAYYEIIGWSASEGTLAQVLSGIDNGNWLDTSTNGVFGWSVLGQVTAGGPGGVSLWGTSGSTVNSGFVLNPVATPEPATMALAGLGGLSLLLFRRKKA